RLFVRTSAALAHLHSFPTRRSSDLNPDDLGKDRAQRRELKRLQQRADGNPDQQDASRDDSDPAAIDRRRVCAFFHDRCGKKWDRSEEHTSELQSRENLVCRLLLEKK